MKILLRHLCFCALLVPAVLAGCERGGGLVDPGPEEPDLTWLRQNAVALATTEPGGGYSDLAPLGTMVGSARIVGLGEATHGTREFFRMKHRALEYLVKERGFNTFAIEAPWAEANRINRYVHTGEGDPEVLLSHLLYWPWNTAEVLEMIRWMRQHNQNPGGAPKVSFYGVDVITSRVAMNDVVAYLRGIGGAPADSAVASYACFHAWRDSTSSIPNYGAAPAQTKESCALGVGAVYQQMQAGATAYAARSGEEAYAMALQAARVVVQNEHYRRDPAQGSARRDQYMAENVGWAAGPDGSGRKVVVWAHNGHVSNRQPWMGWHLSQTHGSAYRIVGFSFHRGPFSVVLDGGPLSSATAPPAQESSYEHQFHLLGLPRFMIDLRPVRAGQAPGAAWLAGPRPMRAIGAVYHPAAPQSAYLPVSLAQEYDVLIHIEESTATQLLPFRFQ